MTHVLKTSYPLNLNTAEYVNSLEGSHRNVFRCLELIMSGISVEAKEEKSFLKKGFFFLIHMKCQVIPTKAIALVLRALSVDDLLYNRFPGATEPTLTTFDAVRQLDLLQLSIKAMQIPVKHKSSALLGQFHWIMVWTQQFWVTHS